MTCEKFEVFNYHMSANNRWLKEILWKTGKVFFSIQFLQKYEIKMMQWKLRQYDGWGRVRNNVKLMDITLSGEECEQVKE